jgi:hypothetical protein
VSDKNSDFHSQFNIYFIGIIIISFISLLLNFFTPLTTLINSIVYLLIIVLFSIKKRFFLNKNYIKFLLISSFLTFLLIIYSTVNRPDAGLYHLPYISIINENKIIFGLSNIHFRFGLISILQYLSAINNNYLFLDNGINIPLASIVSLFYLYFFYDIWKIIKKKESISLSNFFSLFIIIYIAYKMTRYSGFGNEAVAHLSFFYLIHCLLKDNIKQINFNKISLISVFAFINKPTLGIIFIAPLAIFFLQNSLKLKKIFFILISFPALFLYLWLIKNIIISGCAIYPVNLTCIKKLPWVNIEQTANINTEIQAWSKAWPDRTNENLTMEEFNKNFNWLHAWSKKHLKHILNIIIPYIILLFLIILYINIKSKNLAIGNNKNYTTRLFLCLVISGVGVLSFFLLFPLYRFGYSYIITIISLLFILIIKNKALTKENILIYKFIFIICFIIVIAKQGIRIFENCKSSPWPNIYTLDPNGKIYPKTKVIINNVFFYYITDKPEQLCMYSVGSPCTNYPVKNLKYSFKKTYVFLTIN